MEHSHIRLVLREILVIEDEGHEPSGVAEALRGDGHRVTRFTNGLVALAHLHARVHDSLPLPDVLVVDLDLRAISGLEILSSLRAVGWTKRGVLVAASPTPETHRRAADVGDVVVQERPVDLAALRAFVFLATEPQ